MGSPPNFDPSTAIPPYVYPLQSLLSGASDHLLRPAPVREFAIIFATGLHAERRNYRPAFSQTFEQLLGLFAVMHYKDMC
jgi:hypothetical protein